MRTIGLLFFLLFLSAPIAKKNIASSTTHTSFVFKQPYVDFAAGTKRVGQPNTIDTTTLKETAWYTDAIRHIEESEYEISPSATNDCFGSPNRQQNLRAFYTASVFTLQPRDNDDQPTGQAGWQLKLSLCGIYAGKKKIYSVQNNAIAVTAKNTIRFNHNKEFIVEYINNKEGVRQNFIIEKEPAFKPKQLTVKLQANKDWFINKVNQKEIHFAKIKKDAVEKKITYNSLKAWDANNKELEASFAVVENEIFIDVNTGDAVYPITIDPLSTGTSGTVDWIGDDANQPSSYFGYCVSSAGDVNGDGYSDVIMGAYGYDDASTNAGRAFIYHGSATGLPATPNIELHDANVTGALFGRSVACAGDVNGDGYSDVLIGADMINDLPFIREGRVYVHYGSSTGLSLFNDAALKDADQNDGNFGWSIAGAGDINGDGFSDVIVGAYNFDDGFVNEGKVFVYYGSGSGIITTAAVTLADANQVDAQFGVSVAGAGDINGDGYSDIIVGSHLYDDGANTNEGRAFVYYGSSTGLLTSPNIISDADQAFAQLGFSVAGAGDINGDGYSDVVIGANLYTDNFTNEGVAFVYYGSAAGLSSTHDVVLDDADQANANFGARVACAGDVNGDGYSDIIVGSYTYDDNLINEGVAFIYYGSSTGLSASPDCMLDDANGPDASFGYSVASAGDVNGDGYSDVIIGAYTFNYMNNLDYGLTYVYHGSPSGINSSTIAVATIESNQFNGRMGQFISSAGDINADGYSDIIIGSPFYDNGQPDEGAVFIYHGSANGLNTTPVAILERNQGSSFFGYSTSAAGDVNGDGYADIIIGASSFDNGEIDEGSAFIYHGSASGIVTTPAAILEKNQSGAFFGYCVGSAGDINGDGYSDVVVGAPFYDNPETDEGAVFIYYGFPAGINPASSTTLECNQAFAQFGISANAAGDVNGDGFSDLVVGANKYDNTLTDEGAAFLYNGTAIGINTIPATMMVCNQAGAYFGTSTFSAGDINADGFCDVVIGAYQYDNGQTDEGAIFIYHGSIAGVNASATTIIESNMAGAFLGVDVKSAGDVNGDGYADIIAGASEYTNGEASEGAAYIFQGSPTGINIIAAAILEKNQASSDMGLSVSSAGDVNGDGYSDVMVSAPRYNDPTSDEGAVFLYMGNNGKGKRNNLRLYNSDLITPIQQVNMNDPNLFGAGLFAKSFLGKQKGKLVYQTVKNGVAFTGSPITNSTLYTSQETFYSDLGLTGFELKKQIPKQIPTKATYIRARVKYDPVTSITGQVYGPWRYPEGFMRGRRDIGSVALPVKFISFTVIKENGSAKLKWITTDEEPGVRFEVQHSIDGINFITLAVVNGNNNSRNEYEWIHINPAKGNNFYRIKAIENKTVFSPVRMISFDATFTTNIYPNPVTSGQRVTIKNESIGKDKMVGLSVFSLTGQLTWQKQVTAAADGILFLDMPPIPAGTWLLQIETGQYTGKAKIVVKK